MIGIVTVILQSEYDYPEMKGIYKAKEIVK
jgi:hypothetical protein